MSGVGADPQDPGDAGSHVRRSARTRNFDVSRISCTLQVLHRAVTSGLTDRNLLAPFSVDAGRWNGWTHSYLVGLLGTVFQKTSESNNTSCNSDYHHFLNLVKELFGKVAKEWSCESLKSAEAKWKALYAGSKLLDARWNEIEWLFTEWAPSTLPGTPFDAHWIKASLALSSPVLRVHAKFIAELGRKLLDWAYNWIRDDGGSFMKRNGESERLPAGMRLAELADFSVELLRRAEVLRMDHKLHFHEVLHLANKTISKAEVSFSPFLQYMHVHIKLLLIV